MRRFYYFFIILCAGCLTTFSQNPEISSELPDVIPPSPTVASLMKFEEIPVNNYTGIPDISIPLFQSPTLSKDIQLNLALKYHPSSVAVNEKAGDVGLGWSLFAGGTVSRIVRGHPDEILNTQGILNGKGKVGMYHTTGPFGNVFTTILDNSLNGFNSSAQQLHQHNRYLWETVEKGIYDTEHDSWQFNFMGKSGSFIIRKNTSNGLLEVSNLDFSSNLKIINLYNSSDFKPEGFIIYDDLGYRYEFDIIETTISNTTTTTTYIFDAPLSNVSDDTEHRSAFHLSRIYDNNNQLLVTFNYTDSLNDKNIEKTIDLTTESLIPLSTTFQDDLNFLINNVYPNAGKTLGITSNNTMSYRRTTTRKLTSIDVEKRSKILLNYQKGRLDSNLHWGDSSYVFKGIEVRDWYENPIKKISLQHEYKTTIDQRLFLKAVDFYDILNNKKETYNLYYFQYLAENEGNFSRDYYGYFNIRPYNQIEGGLYYRKVHPQACYHEVLQKMELPTGGSTVYHYEPNTFSFIGSEQLEDFDENPLNWEEQQETVNFEILSEDKFDFFTIYDSQDVILHANITVSGTFSDLRYLIYKLENGIYTNIGSFDYFHCDQLNCTQTLSNLAPGEYFVSISSIDLNFPSTFNSEITAYYKTRNQLNLEYLIGGGFRIKTIGYFDTFVNQNYYLTPNQTEIPSKEVQFDYQMFDEPGLSSGSLVSGFPVYEYTFFKSTFLPQVIYTNDCAGYVSPSFHFKKYTDYNNVRAIKTAGADVGYKNVKVFESQNGYSRYVFSSPIDAPLTINNTFPFIPMSIEDFKYGNLLNTKHYDKDHRILKEEDNVYEYLVEEPNVSPLNVYGLHFNVNYSLNTIYSTHTVINNPYTWMFKNYSAYYQAFQFLEQNPCLSGQIVCFRLDDVKIPCTEKDVLILPHQYVQINHLIHYNGYASLKEKLSKEYYYQGASQQVLESSEMFEYNPINKKLSKHIVSDIYGDIYETLYFYHSGNSVYSQNRISAIERIESYKNQQLTGIRKINYSNGFVGNSSFLPMQVQVSKGSGALETKVIYERYDSKSHPLQLRQESGIAISYIYGYNQSLPVAKLENIAYDNIPAQLITAIQSATDATNYNEQNVLTALEALRTSTDPNMQKAMITTYTHKPLIGISTVIDPRGQRQTYIYDEFNRLKEVRDHFGNLLSENEYHYRTQN